MAQNKMIYAFPIVAVFLAAMLAAPIAYASQPITGGGTYIVTASTINNVKSIGDTLIITETLTFVDSGIQSGTFVGVQKAVVRLSTGDFTLTGHGTFTGTILGIPVNAKLDYRASGSGVTYQGTFTEADGTAGVSGHGTFAGTNPGLGSTGTYTALYHVKP